MVRLVAQAGGASLGCRGDVLREGGAPSVSVHPGNRSRLQLLPWTALPRARAGILRGSSAALFTLQARAPGTGGVLRRLLRLRILQSGRTFCAGGQDPSAELFLLFWEALHCLVLLVFR